MKTRVKKWGNSLGLRIPKLFADEVGLEKESSVEMSLQDGKLIVSPIAAPNPSLSELLAGITEANIHREEDFGPAAGDEA